MEMRPFGKTGLEVSALGFGGAELGGADLGYPPVDASRAERVLGTALDSGITVIDTAECYGRSEELIGAAISHRRSEYSLFSKVGHPGGMGSDEDWSRESILASVARSLKRLRTDHLDLVQLHSCELGVLQDGEAAEALAEAKRKGYTRFIGCSGDGEAAKFAVACGAFDALQTSISVADQQPLDLFLDSAREKGLGVIAKRPVANAAWRHGDTAPDYDYHAEYWKRLRKLDYAFTKKALADAVAHALRFTIGLPGVHTAIVGTSNPERFKTNARAIEAGPLPQEESDAIRARWKEAADPSWEGRS